MNFGALPVDGIFRQDKKARCAENGEKIVAKARSTAFFCKECGYESAKWLGQCPVCKEWNTFVEEPVAQAKKAPAGQVSATGTGKMAVPVHISEISLDEQDRTPTGLGSLTGFSEVGS